MKILFDIGHPAHVHLFKNFIQYLVKNKHYVFVVTRNKEITNKLLTHYQIPYKSLTNPGKSLTGLLVELFIRDIKLLGIHIKRKFDIAFGTSVSIGHLSSISKLKTYNFNEDDDAVVPFYTNLAYPFSTKIVNPTCIEYKKWSKKRILVPSYHELAYLHPGNFTPDKNILRKYNLKEKKYIILRLSALRAHHDTKAKGVSEELWKKIETLTSNYQVIKTIENEKSHFIEPWEMHHVLAFSKMIISDSQTMTIEGSVLGIPSIRINTFIDKSTVIGELEKKYGLAYGFLPGKEKNILSTIQDLLCDDQLEEKWNNKKEKLLKDKIDLNQWIIGFFENNINHKK